MRIYLHIGDYKFELTWEVVKDDSRNTGPSAADPE
jgi:hypothetical protein